MDGDPGDQHPDGLDEAVTALHAAVDRWRDVVVGVGSESTTAQDAVADPRLEAAESDVARALDGVHSAAGDVLGLTGGEPVETADEDLLEGDIFFLQFFVGLPDGVPPDALDGVIDLLDAGGFALIAQLEQAGFVVPTFAASRGELSADLLADDEPGQTPGVGEGREEL